MNIFPYGHSGVALYRVPWATIVILVVCVVALLLTYGPSNRAWERSIEIYWEIIDSFIANPTLELEPWMLETFLRSKGVDEYGREAYLESLQKQAEENPQPGATTTQEEIDLLTQEYWTVRRSSPNYRFGLVPADDTPLSYVTSMFMHGDWRHLIGNMVFLFLTAPYLEQRWGRPLFVGCFVGVGFLTGVLWVARHPGSDVFALGSSGSIAGLMGAFLICFGAAKIRFAYWFVVVWGAFEVRAWLVLPAWLAKEVFAARQQDILMQGAAGGVGHWTHVWGFIFGMAFAWGLDFAGLDRHLGDVVADEPVVPVRVRRPSAEVVQIGPSEMPVSAASAVSALNEGTARRRDCGLDEARPDPGFADVEVGKAPLVNEREVRQRTAERLQVVEGVPKVMGESVLRFEVAGAIRTLDLGRVEAIAVGAIEQPGGRPFIVLDLLLDPPWKDDGDLRTVRLRSPTFDPRALVGGEDPMEAFSRLLERLLGASSAAPLPDGGSLRSPGSTTYASLEEYQSEVLGVAGVFERSTLV
ncbi:MAG: rhomboid family intramembrane serine protease [Thermoanaerobaculales bacterium]|jgi:membrane associated rhomboid family serine protease|nr:rhomboid family intramembrane serine protease [Thermoanaerobaculales bacterium]